MAVKSSSILIVDDLPDWRTTISGLLRDEGYSVDVAASTKEALDKLGAGHFDLAILDMRLDDSDEENTEGLDVLAKEIKKQWPKIKTIILTGYLTPDTQKRAMEPDAGGQRLVEDFIEKTETVELVKTVNELLADNNS